MSIGDHAGKLAVYDLERPEVAVYSQQAHTSIINAIDGCGGMDIGNGAPEIVTGRCRFRITANFLIDH